VAPVPNLFPPSDCMRHDRLPLYAIFLTITPSSSKHKEEEFAFSPVAWLPSPATPPQRSASPQFRCALQQTDERRTAMQDPSAASTAQSPALCPRTYLSLASLSHLCNRVPPPGCVPRTGHIAPRRQAAPSF
jgi:hypothetical protein